jgi:hypothetical protein
MPMDSNSEFLQIMNKCKLELQFFFMNEKPYVGGQY